MAEAVLKAPVFVNVWKDIQVICVNGVPVLRHHAEKMETASTWSQSTASQPTLLLFAVVPTASKVNSVKL